MWARDAQSKRSKPIRVRVSRDPVKFSVGNERLCRCFLVLSQSAPPLSRVCPCACSWAAVNSVGFQVHLRTLVPEDAGAEEQQRWRDLRRVVAALLHHHHQGTVHTTLLTPPPSRYGAHNSTPPPPSRYGAHNYSTTTIKVRCTQLY